MNGMTRLVGVAAVGVAVLGVAGLGLLVGCNPAHAAKDGAAVPEVGVVAARRTTIARSIAVAGTLEPFAKAAIRPRIDGFVEKLEVDIGSRVKAGDTLAFVASPELDAELEAIRARAAAMKVKAAGAESLGRVSRKRYSRLNKLMRGAPEAIAAHRVDAAEHHVVSTRNMQASAEAEQRALLAEMRKAEVLRDYQAIKAPFAGVIVKRMVDVGDLVHPTGAPMFELQATDKLRGRFALPEAEAMRVVIGKTAVSLSIPAAPTMTAVAAVVARGSGAVDPKTRTVTFEADVTPPHASWMPGLYAKVTVDLFRKQGALTLPAKALVPGKKGSSVWLCKGGKASKVAVKLGEDDGKVVEVLQGVGEGDAVVLTGKESLAAGGPCKVSKP